MTNINDVKDFWERNLCLDSYLKSEKLTKEYFEESSKLRYKYHYHIPLAIKHLAEKKPGGKVLEIGVGMGDDTKLLCEQEFNVFGIDLTTKSIETAKQRLELYGLNGNLNVGNAENLGFNDETFDIVYSFGVLHHTPDTQKSINEVYRVLKPNGIALIMLYNKNSLNYFTHWITNTQYDGTKKDKCPIERAYTKNELKNMFKQFSNVTIKTDYLFGTGWRWVNYLVPLFIKKPLGKLMGWHNMIWAKK